MKAKILKGLALGLLIGMTTAPLSAQTSAPAEPAAEPSVGEEVGYGVGTALANVFYIPAKVTYAGLGLITGGLGYVLSGGRTEVASNIIYPAVRGHYVITPDQLKGKEPIYFVGAPPPQDDPQDVAATPPATR